MQRCTDMGRAIVCVHAPEWLEEVPQPRPQPFQRVVVDLADPVPVVLPRRLTHYVADRQIQPAHTGQPVVPAPLVGEQAHFRPGRSHHHAPERLVDVLDHRHPDPAPLMSDDPAERRAVVLPSAGPRALRLSFHRSVAS
jgi:hypothetical protein